MSALLIAAAFLAERPAPVQLLGVATLAGRRARSGRYDALLMRRVLITGVTGSAGSHLAERLVERGDEVHGLAEA